MNIKHLEVLIMKILLKAVCCVLFTIWIVLIPILFIIDLGVVITYAIIKNVSIKESLSEYWHSSCQLVPSLLKESLRTIFNRE